MAARPNVFTIPAGVPFLPTLADAVLAGRFGALPGLGADPLALAGVTILLPTRRAVRALREAFLKRLGGAAAILPAIRPIGDVDEEEHLLQPPAEGAGDRLMLPPMIPRLERLLVLTRLVLGWARALRREQLALRPDEPVLIATGAGDAARLAGDLARLMDEMTAAGIDWQSLAGLVPDDYPRFWQLTLDFLKIATEAWPLHLAEKHLADPAARRDELIRLAAARTRAGTASGLTIAAGSTGSVPATADLLVAIAGAPDGAVVLPGLDLVLDAGGWDAIGGGAIGAPSHPQFGMKQLLAAIGMARAEVETIGAPPTALVARARLLSEALRPAETTEAWANIVPPPAAALDGVALLVARHEQQEAVSIALALREAVERRGIVAALVTPDRNLARRVALELKRWKVEVDDSAGVPLSATPPAVFARLLLDAALAGGDPVALLALLKHPLAGFGLAPEQCRRSARLLEIGLLRGPRVAGGVAALPKGVSDTRFLIEWKETTRFLHRSKKRLRIDDWNAAEKLAQRVAAALAPLEAASRAGGQFTVAASTRLLLAALEHAAAPPAAGRLALWSGRAGEGLATLLAGLLSPAADDVEMPLEHFPGFLAAAMGAVAVTPAPGADPRIHIWGTLEARLQSADLIVLGGLDEGVWPPETRTDPWLSRPMRAAIGLPAPERRIGLAAHDFAEAMVAPQVIVTRAEKRGGAPTVPSRWLQRLLAICRKPQAEAMLARGRRYVELARDLDSVPRSAVRAAPRPAPRPPVAARPRNLSLSDIETWIRDPYAVYAKRILGLAPLDDPGEPPNPATRGSLVHDVLAAFTKADLPPGDPAARDRLLTIWREQLRPIEAFPEIHALWWLRAQPIADWFLEWEAGRHADIETRFAEIDGAVEFAAPAGPFKLRARADRIDLRRDGAIDIFDYKSGLPPSAKQVLPFAPQLALEVAIARSGGFRPELAGRSVAALAWIALAQVDKQPVRPALEGDWTADAIGEAALGRLRRLVEAYDDAAKPYVSQARPMFERRFPGDYDHLARVAEWRLAGGGDDA